jgi:TPR repeat protein
MHSTPLVRSLPLCLLASIAFGAVAPDIELKDPSGKTIIRYVVDAPRDLAPAGTTDPARQVGLFLCFPEHDRPTGDEILPVREALRRLGLRDQYVLLAGHPQAQKFGPADHEPIRQLIEWARRTYPINPRRIYMYGKGEGGKISGEFGMAHPELVTAGITYSWGWWIMPSELNAPLDPAAAPEYYMVLGLRDLSHHLTTVRDTYGRVNAKGYHVIYREIDDLGARTYHPPTNDDAVAWATRLRNKTIAPSAGELALLKSPRPAGGYFPSLALVGGAPAGAVVRQLLDSPDAATRAAAARTGAHGIFDEATTAAIGRRLTDAAPTVRQAALQAMATNAQWRSAAAQQALIDFVANPETPDRVSAVDAIGQAVRFQVRGVRQDPPLFRALVKLLTDSDEEVRVMAANILAPIRDPEFRGDLGRPELREPGIGWAAWLDEISAKEAGYAQDYAVCGKETGAAVDLYCQGGAALKRSPAAAFQLTLQAAEQGYVPAQAMLGMLYANGKGVQQNYAEAGKWWRKAAEAGHAPARLNASMVPRGGAPAPKK